MNKVILIGRLARDPELRTTPTNVSVATFSIAVSRPFTPQDEQQGTDFINCVIWRRQAENLAKYCHKGSQIAVEGRIQTRNYTAQDGSKRYVTEVMCDNITFLGNSNKSEEKTPGEEVLEQVVNNMIGTQADTQQEDPFKDFNIEHSEELEELEYPF